MGGAVRHEARLRVATQRPHLDFGRDALQAVDLQEWDHVCALIGTSREKCFRVRSLDISHNEGALRSPRRARRLLASLSRALQASRFLRELNAAGCTAADPALWIPPLRALHGVLSRQLHTLSLHGCGLGDAGALELSRSLRSAGVLKVLSVSDNGIGDEGMQALLSSLSRHSMPLETLSVSQNPFGPASLPALLSCLRHARASLQELNTQHCALDSQSHAQLGEALLGLTPVLKKWRYLDLHALHAQRTLHLHALERLQWSELAAVSALCGGGVPLSLAVLGGLPLQRLPEHQQELEQFLRDLLIHFQGQGTLEVPEGNGSPLQRLAQWQVVWHLGWWETPGLVLVGTDRMVDAVCAPVLAWNSMMRRCELLSRKSAGVLGEGWEVVGLWADAHRRGAVVEGQKQLVACEGSP